MSLDTIQIIQPDDWHVHLREGKMLETVIEFSSRINRRCIVMPNLIDPITTLKAGLEYKKNICSLTNKNFVPLLPCYLIENIDLIDFAQAIDDNVFIGAKLYPNKATTNSNFGVSDIEKIFPSLEILDEKKKPLLIHGEKSGDEIDFFDREKLFVDNELTLIRKKFPNLKIILEHVSSKYGADFVNQNENIGATITPHHLFI
jgi:Dihydroorotase